VEVRAAAELLLVHLPRPHAGGEAFAAAADRGRLGETVGGVVSTLTTRAGLRAAWVSGLWFLVLASMRRLPGQGLGCWVMCYRRRSCHYNFAVFEVHQYYSKKLCHCRYNFEVRHYIHLETSWTHCQVYKGLLYICMDKIAPTQLSLSHSLIPQTCGTHMSGSSSTSRPVSPAASEQGQP
jgi:hypothetical protein